MLFKADEIAIFAFSAPSAPRQDCRLAGNDRRLTFSLRTLAVILGPTGRLATGKACRSLRRRLMASFDIGFVLFPNLTQLDLTGPLEVLRRVPGATTHVVAKSEAPVASDCGLALVPTKSFAQCGQLDMICVPGGMGVPDALGDAETLDFIRRQGRGAKYVTSVCTGAFILGAAGLLRGKRATTHWAYTELLPMVGATYQPGRVVRDGNLFTGGGVTAGIDFGLTIAAELAGQEAAEFIQLSIEYAPAPPFAAGDPAEAPAAVRERASPVYAKRLESYRMALQRTVAE
jgi:cyclohexyl-isocyanide hydratase